MSLVDEKNYGPADKLSMQLSSSDVCPGCFENRQFQINRLVPDDNLIVGSDGCINTNGDVVLKFSKKFQETITQLEHQEYRLKNVKVNFNFMKRS